MLAGESSLQISFTTTTTIILFTAVHSYEKSLRFPKGFNSFIIRTNFEWAPIVNTSFKYHCAARVSITAGVGGSNPASPTINTKGANLVGLAPLYISPLYNEKGQSACRFSSSSCTVLHSMHNVVTGRASRRLMLIWPPQDSQIP